MKQDEHWLYVLMHNATKSSMMIMRTSPVGLDFEEMTIADFDKQCGLPDYHEDSEDWLFEFMNQKELNVSNIAQELPSILAHICRQAMMDGKPLTMNEATIAEYGKPLTM